MGVIFPTFLECTVCKEWSPLKRGWGLIFPVFLKCTAFPVVGINHHGIPMFDWLCWVLMTGQSLWIILCCLPGKGRIVCVEILWPCQSNGVMSSTVSLPNHTFTRQTQSSKRLTSTVHSSARNWQLQRKTIENRDGEKWDRRAGREDERKGQGRMRKMNESKETEEIITLLLYHYLL